MPKGKQWDRPAEILLEKLVKEGKTNPQIAEEMEMRLSQVENKIRRMNLVGIRPPAVTRVVSETPERVVYAADDGEDEPIEELLDRTIKATSRAIAKAKARRLGTAKLITSKPIGIAFVSDQHISTDAPVDVEKAFEDARIIQQEPGLFCVLGGDGVDNHIKHRSALVGKRSAPPDEWRLYDHYIQTLGLKVLAMVSGNHDDWTKDFAGVDMVGHLAAKNKVHYAPDEVLLTVELAASAEEEGTEYTAKVRHQYRFNSSLNIGHTVKRLYDMGGDQFDVGVVCHHHEAHVEPFERHGSTRWALRPGSYQIHSSHSRRYGYNLTYPTCPVAIFWPDERRVVCLKDLREGITHLRAARSGIDIDLLPAA